MTQSDHQHGPDQRQLTKAYHTAAVLHDQSADMHESAAENYRKNGHFAKAWMERRKENIQRRNATADRVRATGSSSSESGTLDSQEPKGVDLAALLGATVALLLTLTFGAGAWGPLSTIVGSLLLVVLLAFFWRRRVSARQRRTSTAKIRISESVFIGLALSAVVGLLGAITSAEVIQHRVYSDLTNRFGCRSVAVAQATAAVRDLSEVRARETLLQDLIDEKLNPGGQQSKTVKPKNYDARVWTADAAVRFAFDHQYDSAVGDCLAGETLNSLWWIGGFCAFLTLIWWCWNLVPRHIKCPVIDLLTKGARQ